MIVLSWAAHNHKGRVNRRFTSNRIAGVAILRQLLSGGSDFGLKAHGDMFAVWERFTYCRYDASVMNFASVAAMLCIAFLAQGTPASHVPVSVTSLLSVEASQDRVEYRNTGYGFCWSLPESWNRYSVVLQTWKGSAIGPKGYKTVARGPIIAIRHPQWTSENPRQDIPVMVFTRAQWDLVRHETIVVSAAPFPPSELGRNAKYVFGLPPRYNYAFPTGYEEVERVLQNGGFHASCLAKRN